MPEFAQFVGARFLTMLIVFLGAMLHDVWKMNDMAAKLVIQVVVMVVNCDFQQSCMYLKKKDWKKSGEKDRKRRNGILALCFFIPAVTMGVALL